MKPQTGPEVGNSQLDVQLHPLVRRIAHWLLALSILIMIGSGWRIYNASPILPFMFPEAITLGGDGARSIVWHNDGGVANAIAWHLAGLWLFAAAGALYLVHSLATRHLQHDLLPIRPRDFLRDFTDALRFRLDHRLGEYNAVQKLFYLGVLLAMSMMLISGAVIWKPVQLHWLTTLFGGFQGARIVHFLFMTAITGFLVVHVVLVAIVPRTLIAMVFGRASAPAHYAAPQSTAPESVGAE